jgi:hypothetical protein
MHMYWIINTAGTADGDENDPCWCDRSVTNM